MGEFGLRTNVILILHDTSSLLMQDKSAGVVMSISRKAAKLSGSRLVLMRSQYYTVLPSAQEARQRIYTSISQQEVRLSSAIFSNSEIAVFACKASTTYL